MRGSLVLANATLPDGATRDVRIADGRIDALDDSLDGHLEVDLTGRRLFPGMIDVHVHFREPGFPHKETWETGSRSAAAGGVTTVVDQPNTDPPTIDGPAFDLKARAAERSLVDYGLNGGVTPDWDPEALFDRPLLALGEVFLADSTGEMGIEPALFREAVERAVEAGVRVTVHAEDADEFDPSVRDRTDADAWSAYRRPAAEAAAVEAACAVGADVGTRLHIAHTSTPEGIDLASEYGATCEVTPHHLLLSRDDLADLGTFGRMNPPLRSEGRRRGVYERVVDGSVDMIATDHAPHTRKEKAASIWDAPSGVPGVETAFPLLLEEARQDRLPYSRVRDLTARRPAEVFDLPTKGRIEPGRDADLVVVDPDRASPIRGAALHTKCDWTPFEGRLGVFPEWTMRRGQIVYQSAAAELPPDLSLDSPFGEVDGRNVRR